MTVMLLLLVLLIALAGAGMGVYIAGNGGGSLDVSFLGQHWTGVDAWLPPLAIASTFAALGILAVTYGWLRIRMLKHGYDALRSEVDRLRGAVTAVTEAAVAEHRAGGVQATGTVVPAAAPARADDDAAERRRRWFGLVPDSASPASEARDEQAVRSAEPLAR
jgi:hypothetical protein